MSTVTRSHPFATVIDTRPGEVRVRLADNAELPRWYPSVLDTTDIGTEGVMLRANQEDMVFVPNGVGLATDDHDHDGTYAPTVHTHEYDDVLFPLSGGVLIDDAAYMGMKDGLGEVQVYDNGSIFLKTGAVGNAGSIILGASGIVVYSNIDMLTAAPVNASHLTRKDYVDALVAAAKPFSISQSANPAAESNTGVGTYSTAGVLRSSTLTSLFPAITTGTWDVDIHAYAVVYRNVATGGVFVYVGDGTSATDQALGRLSPQTHAYTLEVNVSIKGMAPGGTIDLRYTGFSTAGTTYVISHGWQITARRA